MDDEIPYDTIEDIPNRRKTMGQAQGQVERVSSKVVKGGKTIYSFRLVDVDQWYGTDFTPPPFEEGDEVRFDYNDSQYGPKVIINTIKSRKSDKPLPEKKQYKGKGGGGAKDDYWKEKEQYDRTVRQPLIMYQSATGVAAQLVTAALEQGILPIAKNAKAQDKYDLFLSLVGTVRDDLFAQYMAAEEKCKAGQSILDTPAVHEEPGSEEFIESDDAETDPDSWGEEDDNDGWE